MWNAEDRQVVGHGETTKGLEVALASRSLITSPQGGGGGWAGDYRRLGETLGHRAAASSVLLGHQLPSPMGVRPACSGSGQSCRVS